jgi:hypothetical protein
VKSDAFQGKEIAQLLRSLNIAEAGKYEFITPLSTNEFKFFFTIKEKSYKKTTIGSGRNKKTIETFEKNLKKEIEIRAYAQIGYDESKKRDVFLIKKIDIVNIKTL